MVIVEEQQIEYDGPNLPEVTFDSSMLLVIDDGYGGLIRLYIVGAQYQFTYSIIQWPQQVGDLQEPVVHRWWR